MALKEDGTIVGWGLNNYGQADPPADRGALPARPVRRGAHVIATRWWRLVAGTAAGLLVVVALLLTALRIAIAYVPHNEQKLRTWIERQTHMKFEYSRLDARLRWYGPEIVLRPMLVAAASPIAELKSTALPNAEDIPNNHKSYAAQWVLFAAVALVIYVLAARMEEGKFANTPMSAEYQAYRRRTGFFFPKIAGT